MVCMNSVTLPPDLENFANEAVANGRFSGVSEVVRAGVSLLRRAEAERATFVASLEAAEAEAEQNGFVEADDALKEMDEMIRAAGRSGRLAEQRPPHRQPALIYVRLWLGLFGRVPARPRRSGSLSTRH